MDDFLTDKSVKPNPPLGWKAYWSTKKSKWFFSEKLTSKTQWTAPEGTTFRTKKKKVEEATFPDYPPPQKRKEDHKGQKRKKEDVLKEEISKMTPSSSEDGRVKEGPLTKESTEPKGSPQAVKLDTQALSDLLASIGKSMKSDPVPLPKDPMPSPTGPVSLPDHEEADSDILLVPSVPEQPSGPTHQIPVPSSNPIPPKPTYTPSYDVNRELNDHWSRHEETHGQKSKRERDESPIIRMRNQNNWIKTVLTETACGIWAKGAPISILELACGSRGELNKWPKVARKWSQDIQVFMAVDLSKARADSCQRMASDRLPPSTRTYIFAEDLDRPVALERMIDCVGTNSMKIASMHFALHYFFKSEASIVNIFRTLSNMLVNGGVFICTYADGNTIVRKAREARWKFVEKNGYEPVSVEVNEDLYSIEMPLHVLEDIETSAVPFGHAYRFTLTDAVKNQQEYLVIDEVLTQIAESFGFKTAIEQNFQPFTKSVMKKPEHQDSMRFLKVFGRQDILYPEEWDAISLYKIRVFIFDPKGNRGHLATDYVQRFLY